MELAKDGNENARPLVILVEDDAAIAEMYRLGLESDGFNVIVVTDGSALFKSIDDQVPAVAVLDWHLAGLLTGIDILENLRLDERTAGLPILMLTNHQGRVDGLRDRARQAGALEWLIKTETSPLRLASRLRHALRPGAPIHVAPR